MNASVVPWPATTRRIMPMATAPSHARPHAAGEPSVVCAFWARRGIDAYDSVRPVARIAHQDGVAFVATFCPVARSLDGLAVRVVTCDEPVDPRVVVNLQEPGQVEDLTDFGPWLRVEQEVVAFDDDDRRLARNGYAGGDWFLEVA